ncbi:MAG: Calx-beta domain-containing protein, partial [Planctomycetaceae bacterium]
GETVTLVQELVVTDSTVRNNVARLQGGGIFSQGDMIITGSTLSGNVSHVQGGGLFNESTVTIMDSTLDANIAEGIGGGIYNNGTPTGSSRVTVTGSTLSNNEAGAKGGGLYNNDMVTLLNSTFSANVAGAAGGGIYNASDASTGSVSITNATLVENRTDGAGGGVVNEAGATVDVQNSIVAANTALGQDADLNGAFISLGTNFIGDSGSSSGFVNGQAGDQVGTTLSPFDPVLGSLADNGGSTLTHALLVGSPAIDSGNNSGGDPVDQRGGRRPTDNTADVGAFEIQDNRISIGDLTQVEGAGGSTTFVFTVLLEAVTAEPITLDFTTVQDTARNGEDFIPVSGTVNFESGEQTQTVTVEVNGDTTPEATEQFFVQLSNPTNATLVDDLAVGTILNDDAIITVAAASAAETDSGTTTLTFTVELLDAVGLPTSSVNTVTVNYATADGTAVNTGMNPDYVATSGTLTFAPGETSKTVDVMVIGDAILEPDETVVLNLSGAMDSEGNVVAVADAS